MEPGDLQLESRRYRKRISFPLYNVAHDACFLPLFGLAADVVEDSVHFLEGFAGGFGDDEEGEDEGEEAEDGEEDVSAVSSVLYEGRGDEALLVDRVRWSERGIQGV